MQRVCAAAVLWPNRVALVVGGIALASAAALIMVDVIMRNLFSIVVPGGLEMTGLLTILITLSALGAVEIERNHVRVDVLLRLLPEAIRAPCVAGGHLLAFGILLLTSWQVLAQSSYLWRNQIVTGVLGLPEWAFVGAAAVAMVLFAIALLANALRRRIGEGLRSGQGRPVQS